MDKYTGYGFADLEIAERFQEETYLDKINKLINWKKIDKILKRD